VCLKAHMGTQPVHCNNRWYCLQGQPGHKCCRCRCF
jgi:hypothetical protein